MRPFVKDTVPFLHDAIKEGKHILIEGAQSAILDIDFGRCNLSLINHISGMMVSVLAAGGVDRGFELRSDKTKDYETGMCSFSANNTAQ